MSGLRWWRQWLFVVAMVLRVPALWGLLENLLHAALLRVLVDIALTRGLVIIEVEA